MTKINEISSANNNIQSASSSTDVQYDAVSKSLESKIMDARQRQKGLNSDSAMSAEEKSSARQEIQREISDLKRQLRQRQTEQKKEQQKENKTAEERKERLKGEDSDKAVGVVYESSTADRLKKEREDELKEDQVKGDKSDEDKIKEDESRQDRPEDASFSKEAAMSRIRVIVNEDTKADGKIRVIEAEEKQDSIGKTAGAGAKSRLSDAAKRAQRVEIAQKAMFGDNGKKTDRTAGLGGNLYDDDRYKGLYNNKGVLLADAMFF